MGLLPVVGNGAGSQGLFRGARRSGLGETERSCQAVDFRMRRFSKMTRFPRPADGLRAMAERTPQAEALAASWIECVRPLGTRVYALRRRIATLAVAVLACLLFGHVMFGANGMVVYRQKRAEYESLRNKVMDVQREN